MTRLGLALAILGLAALWLDPAGLGWTGAALMTAGGLLLIYRAAVAGRRRASLQTLRGLRGLSPEEFERAVASWLRREGWRVELVGRPGDGGIDIVARRGRELAFVQCKRLRGEAVVSAPVVRDLYGTASAGGATLAALVTTGRISAAARSWADEVPDGPRLLLIDGDRAVAAARGARLLE